MDSSTTYRKVQRMVKPTAGCSLRKGAKTPKRAGSTIADDFLRQRFTPYVAQPIAGSCRKMERDFFTSLSNLCGLYGMAEWEYSDYCYPLNITIAYKETTKRLEAMDKELRLAIVLENRKVTLATYKELNSRNRLYYIPVKPLFDLFKQEQSKELSALLLSVFAYLYRILRVPLYSHPYSYLNGVYEILWEYCTEDDLYERETVAEYIQTIRLAIRCGGKLYKKIRGAKNLSLFGERIKQFKPQSNQEREIKKVAKAFYRLYQQFPERSLSDNLNTDLLNPEAEYRIYFEQYLSFIWDTNDCLIENIIEHINCDLQEAEEEEDPCSIQLFHEPQNSATFDLSFEKKAFEWIDELAYLLTNL